MEVSSDLESESLMRALRDEPIRESGQVRPGFIADFGSGDGIVRFEILRASQVVTSPRNVEFALRE